jgi:type IV secretory pathway VirB2 component (pilin)
MKIINKKTILAGLVLLPVLATASASGSGSGMSDVLAKIFESSSGVIKAGFAVGAIYAVYQLFIQNEKSALNWFLLIFGAAMIGAYDTITKAIVSLVSSAG